MLITELLVATGVAFAISGAYYALAPLPESGDARQPAPPAWVQGITELLRSALVAGLVTGLISLAGWSTLAQGALLGLSLWVIPVVLLAGAVIHEGTPWRSAVIHSGDWLAKLVAIGALVGALA